MGHAAIAESGQKNLTIVIFFHHTRSPATCCGVGAAAPEKYVKGLNGAACRVRFTAMDDATAIATALRTARKTRKVSLAALAASAGVSPRLIGEFERGQRPNVSLETALRLLALLDVRLIVEGGPAAAEDAAARAQRAALRRETWVGIKGRVSAQDVPEPPASPAHRVRAVAATSQVAHSLKHARRVRG